MKRIIGLAVALILVAFGVHAAEVTIGLEWGANVEVNLGGYGVYMSDTSGDYGESKKIVDVLKGIEEAYYTFLVPDGQTTTMYWVVDAHNDETPPLRSGYSNEVLWVYDYSPIEPVSAFTASKIVDSVTLQWTQNDLERAVRWGVYFKEVGDVDFVQLDEIVKVGEGPFSTTVTMDVPDGEMKMFVFVVVTFTETDVHSDNSNEVTVSIDRRHPSAVKGLKIKVN